MITGLSTANYYPDLNTEDIVELFGENGIRHLEIFLNTFSEIYEDFCLSLREKLEYYGLKCTSVHVMSSMMEPCLFDIHKRRREDYLEIFKKTLRAIEILGSKVYTFHGPPEYSLGASSLTHIADCYDRLYYMAGEKGIHIGQENVFYLASGRIKFLEEIKEKMKEKMEFTLDVKQARRSGVNLKELISIMGDGLVNLHLSDGDENNTCLLPGRGNFSFRELFYELSKYGYEGPSVLELYRKDFKGIEELLKGIRFIAEELK